jgi:hypothetical protein
MVYATRGVLDFGSYLSRALGAEMIGKLMPLFFCVSFYFAPKHRAPEHVGKKG